MFQITDELLDQAGFDALTGEHREKLRQQVTENVERRIGESIAAAVDERQLDEIQQLMDDDYALGREVARRIDTNYRQSPIFMEMERLGRANDASEDDIVQQFAIMAWFQEQHIDIHTVVQQAMNEAIAELQSFRQMAA